MAIIVLTHFLKRTLRAKFRQSKFVKGSACPNGVCMAASLEFINQCCMRNSKKMDKLKTFQDALKVVIKEIESVIKAQSRANVQQKECLEEGECLAAKIRRNRAKFNGQGEVLKQLDDQRRLFDFALKAIAECDADDRPVTPTEFREALNRLVRQKPQLSVTIAGLSLLYGHVTNECNQLGQAMAAREQKLQKLYADVETRGEAIAEYTIEPWYEDIATDKHLSLGTATEGHVTDGFEQTVARAIPQNSYFLYSMNPDKGNGHTISGFHSDTVKNTFGKTSEHLVVFDPNIGIFRCSYEKAPTFFKNIHLAYLKSATDLTPCYTKWRVVPVTHS